MVRSSVAFTLSLVVGCQVAPAPVAVAPCACPSRQANDEVNRLIAQLQFQRLGDGFEPVEPAGTSELAARLATLNEHLGELLLRLPGTGAAGAADASAARGERAGAAAVAAAGPADPADLDLLRQALGVVEQQRRVCLQNLANVNTVGWKKRAMYVTTVMHAPTGVELPVAGPVHMVCTAGALEITDRSLDVAIDGDGCFAVVLPDGTCGYTRDGTFHLNADGKLVTGSGNVLLPEITVPNDTLEISIDPEGCVSGRCAGSPDTSTRFGQLTLHRFVNPSGLLAVGANVLRQTEASGPPITGTPGSNGLGTLKQGFVERSNVQVLDELVNLQALDRQRAVLVRVLAGYGVFVR
ncbi:MAG: flagellar hook-basal body complex protein [Planctomycetes bacterium]|nr:flagellar hook-basal body complex protein [Planctomycetota bacterium]